MRMQHERRRGLSRSKSVRGDMADAVWDELAETQEVRCDLSFVLRLTQRRFTMSCRRWRTLGHDDACLRVGRTNRRAQLEQKMTGQFQRFRNHAPAVLEPRCFCFWNLAGPGFGISVRLVFESVRDPIRPCKPTKQEMHEPAFLHGCRYDHPATLH